MPANPATSYGRQFFEYLHEGAQRSAEVTIHELLSLLAPFRPQSVIDVGCGTGEWLAVCRSHGIADVLGVDGNYVDKSLLQIPESNFLAWDLTQPLRLNRRSDLALSLEVGEHLPPESADTLVESLVRISALVVFSAAIPHQGGVSHLNEQWPKYWAERFRAKGYVTVDALRPKLWENDAVDVWYAQNMLLFVEQNRIGDFPALTSAVTKHVLPLVHPRIYLDKIGTLRARDPQNMGIRDVLSVLPRALTKTVRRRLPKG